MLYCVCSVDIYDFSAGMTLVWVIGTPISQTLSVSMLSKHFSQQQKAGIAPTRGVGFWMGLVTAAGSVGRILFPLVAGSLSSPAACLFASLSAFGTLPLIFFPLKAYRPYLPWFKDRLSCLFPAEPEHHGGRMLRTSSNGDRTEMLMLADDVPRGGDPSAVSPPANDLLRGASSVSVQSDAMLTSQPLMYFVSSEAQEQAREATPLVGKDRRGSLRNINYHATATPSHKSNET